MRLTFFIIPALRFENVICLRDLSLMYSILILRRPGSPSLSTYVKPPGWSAWPRARFDDVPSGVSIHQRGPIAGTVGTHHRHHPHHLRHPALSLLGTCGPYLTRDDRGRDYWPCSTTEHAYVYVHGDWSSDPVVYP
jgi:hypothetical protein